MNTMVFTQTYQSNYEELCKLDALGLRDMADHDQSIVFAEFKERLMHSREGWYETTLPWKANHPELPSNKEGSLKCLKNLRRKLQSKGITEQYDAIIQEHLEKEPRLTATEGILYPSQERDSQVCRNYKDANCL